MALYPSEICSYVKMSKVFCSSSKYDIVQNYLKPSCKAFTELHKSSVWKSIYKPKLSLWMAASLQTLCRASERLWTPQITSQQPCSSSKNGESCRALLSTGKKESRLVIKICCFLPSHHRNVVVFQEASEKTLNKSFPRITRLVPLMSKYFPWFLTCQTTRLCSDRVWEVVYSILLCHSETGLADTFRLRSKFKYNT